MSAIISWNVASLERETSDDFVFTVHWTVNAVEGEYSASAYGSIGLERPDELIPYADLTPEIVIGWVQDKLGDDKKAAEIEAALQAKIDEQRAPSKVAGVPWNN